MSRPILTAAAAVIVVPVLTILLLVVTVLGAPDQAGSATTDPAYPVSAEARADIPPDYLQLYLQAAANAGLDWSILAAIGKVETDHGRLNALGVTSGVNSYGCCGGPMQFWIAPPHPNTWDSYGVDGNHDGRKDPHNPADAIPAAAKYLKASGAPADYRRAIFAYNHATWYVDQVLAQAARYREQADASLQLPTRRRRSPADDRRRRRRDRPSDGSRTATAAATAPPRPARRAASTAGTRTPNGRSTTAPTKASTAPQPSPSSSRPPATRSHDDLRPSSKRWGETRAGESRDRLRKQHAHLHPDRTQILGHKPRELPPRTRLAHPTQPDRIRGQAPTRPLTATPTRPGSKTPPCDPPPSQPAAAQAAPNPPSRPTASAFPTTSNTQPGAHGATS